MHDMDDLHEASSRGWDGVRASCGCRLPCCQGGSPDLRTVVRGLVGAMVGQYREIANRREIANSDMKNKVIVDFSSMGKSPLQRRLIC